jgi:hypothetical protein
MFNSSEFKYLVKEEDDCAEQTEKLSNHIRAYFENKSKRKLSSEELMILAHNDFWCREAIKELEKKYKYKNKLSEMIDSAGIYVEKLLKDNSVKEDIN